DVVHLPADLAGAPAGKALDQAVQVDVHQDGGVQRLAEADQHLVQGLRLRDVAREAVHDEAVLRVRALEALADDAEHDLVGDQLAGVHRGLGLPAQRRAGGQRLAQQVAGGNLRYVVFLDQLLGLSPLARTGRSKQHDSHVLSRSPEWTRGVLRAPAKTRSQITFRCTAGQLKPRDISALIDSRGVPQRSKEARLCARHPPALARAPPLIETRISMAAKKKAVRKATGRAAAARKPAPQNAFYAQSGGVTAVINASAAGVIETARKHKDRIGKVFAGRNGIIGALTEDLIDTSKESAAAIAALAHTPGGAFGSCRYKLKGFEENQAEYERLIEVFKAHDIGYFFYNGGGDSADTCLKVSQLSEKMGYPIKAIHVPKTVDNDLPFTDCCPGFGSVAKYVAVSTREASMDVASMCETSTKVFILEVMG